MSAVENVLKALGIVATKKRNEWLALCPAHEDNSPSWHIRDQPGHSKQGLFNCWSCQFSGALPDLVMHVKKVDRDAARAWLKDLGEDPTPEPEPLPETVGLEYGALNSRRFQMPKEFIHEPLAQWVTPARKYVESRGITAPQIAKWSLGYAVDGKLAGRIVIPTTTRLGQVCGYMARSFTNARKRYLYPAASERPNLDAMFGEFHWPASTARRGHSVVVTEGALNALAVERAVPGAFLAALGGRHVRPMHMGKIASFGHVTILTDPDAAGDAVALELQSLLGRHSEVRRVRLPEDQDANDMDASELARRLS